MPPAALPYERAGRNLAVLFCLREETPLAGLAWVAAFENRGRSAQYQPQHSMGFPERSYFETL